MNLTRWELSFGLFEGLLFGYRNYPDLENNKIDHVFYVFNQVHFYQETKEKDLKFQRKRIQLPKYPFYNHNNL